MKNRRNKNALSRYRGNTHKKRAKEKMEEILRSVNEMGVGTDSVKIINSYDGTRRAAISHKQRRDESVSRGVFSSSKSGFGFVTLLDCEGPDIFIPEDKTGGAIDGDLVEIIYHSYISRYGEEKTEGRVKKIVEYGRKTVIGTVILNDRGFRNRKRAAAEYLLLPDDSKIPYRPYISDVMGANAGDKVEALIDRNSGYPFTVSVVRNFGDAYSKEANYEAILSECGIPLDFTPEELSEAERVAAEPISDEGRVRLDGSVIFTIDGEGAKDLDDAVSLKKLPGGGFRLGVHIADVSHYVGEKCALDRAVMSRGTSVYFTDKVVPMLPPVLSNGACSLNAGEDKYALSAIIDLLPTGEIKSLKILPSVIRSCVRGVYSEVNSIFDGNATAEIKKKYKKAIPSLKRMHELYLVLKRKSEERGYLELDVPEAEIILDDEGIPCDVIKRERGDAERMIEQFMLTANEAVASCLYEKKIPCVYRIHENPSPKKLTEFLSYAHNLGFDTSFISHEKSTSRDFSRLLAEATERGLAHPVSYTMLRSMAKAKYSAENSPHFGLGIEYYCHFTSPIRRLSDLATHRIIHKVLLEGAKKEKLSGYARRAAAAATDAEERALQAERRIENLYKVIYMEGMIGSEFDATVSSVTSFGFFAELENTVEGLVPISDLFGMFIFDEKTLTLRSRDVIYRLGDKVRVRLEEADIIRGKLRFSVV